MAWIESHQELGSHPKTRKLAQLLGIHRMQAIGHLHALWWWALDYAEDGDLSRYDAADIALGAEWDGDPDKFVRALVDCGPRGSSGFLDDTGDGLAIHDWAEHTGMFSATREKARRANHQRWHVNRGERVDGCEFCVEDSSTTPHDVPTDSSSNPRGSPGDSLGESTQHNTTKQNQQSRDPVVDDLCDHLAQRIADHRGNGKIPKVTARWRDDIGLLLRRGELHVANPHPWTAIETRERIDAVFDRLNVRSSSGFCWADQVQSPGNLRDKWHKIEPLVAPRRERFEHHEVYR